MRNWLICVSALLMTQATLWSQVEELRKAQKTREKYIQPSTSRKGSPLTYVNPFIGTGGHGHTYPGATAPFGMIQLSPDSRHTGWDGCSGYHYSDSVIYGFSHTHLSGTGVSDYGDLLIVPQCGKPKIDPGYSSKKGYGSRFSHKDEHASPGYYDVKLIDGDINVRLTTTDRCGLHEYTFNDPSGKRFILIDLDHRDQLLDSRINIVDQQTISGHRISNAWATNQHFYFFLKTSLPYQKARLLTKKGRNKLLLVFPKGTEKISVKVGISAVDVAGAKKNLETEITDWNFAKVKSEVSSKWLKELNKVQFESKDREVMINFYTALYHSFIAPNLFSDIDGRYRGRDNQVHQLGSSDQKNYTVFSLWDTYRATHPLFTLTQVDRTNDFIRTFIRQFEQGGDLPVWELAANETECMIGFHSVSVIADAYAKFIDDYDVKKAIDAMIATSNFDEFGKKSFNENGYISTGDEPESVSMALEYAYDNFCIHEMLKMNEFRNNDNDYSDLKEVYKRRSLHFINNYDPNTKFMRGRRSGQWFSPFKPGEVNFNYTEANSWQYSLYTPHAIGVHTELLGGKDALEKWLDDLFNSPSEMSGREQADITGLIGQYAHGNEPSHHMAYLYNYTNAPEKTQFYVDSILKTMYWNGPDGLSGNEDCGQMSSWYVLSALGIYQVAPGRPFYEIGRPLMDKATIRFENEKKLMIQVRNNRPTNKYVQKVVLNGKQLDRLYLTHSDLINGGKLEFVMGSKPNQLAKDYLRAPSMDKLPNTIAPLPFFDQEERIFDESMTISLDMVNRKHYTLAYTLDGSDPRNLENATIYAKPFTIDKTTTVKAVAYNLRGESSIISNEFVKKDNTVSLSLDSKYANQYAASGDFTLIDGIQGGTEYRTGDWQGYWAQDVVAEVHFNDPRKLKEVSLGCLSDVRSWIFYPSEVIIEGSVDGETFTKIGSVKSDASYPSKESDAERKKFTVTTDASTAYKKVRVVAKNFGECPEWHLGAGNDTWLFVDEISFQ